MLVRCSAFAYERDTLTVRFGRNKWMLKQICSDIMYGGGVYVMDRYKKRLKNEKKTKLREKAWQGRINASYYFYLFF